MPLFILILPFVFGAIVGSFLNVVILRWNTGQSILGPRERSRCFSCGKQLVWWELVPILSFFVLRGRCGGCKSKISWQYPTVEVITGVVYALLLFQYHTTPLWFVYYAIVASILIVITFYDVKHKIIPNFFVYGFVVLAAIPALMPLRFSLDLLAGPIFYGAFAALWLISRGRWIGFGDAKLVLGIGLLLGFAHGLSALVLAFWSGALVGIFLIILRVCAARGIVPLSRLPLSVQHLTMKSEVPFAPFLILGTALAFFLQIDVFGIARLF